MTSLTSTQEELCADSRWDFSDLSAVYLNCTLKRSPTQSHTRGLAERSMAIMRRVGVSVQGIRAVDHEVLHLARMLRDNGGVPAHGNQRSIWDREYQAHHDNPEHR